MNIPYELWPIWADYLEEQGQETELLRYVLTWNLFINGIFVENSYYGIGCSYEFTGNGHLYHTYLVDWGFYNMNYYGNAYVFSLFMDSHTFNISILDYDRGYYKQ